LDKTKPFDIPKALVWEAWKLVKVNKGSAGIDRESITDFELNLPSNLYKLWNRLSSGSYFPPAVKGVAIPKKQGGTRMLGVPTVSDRVAQMAIKLAFEPHVEPHFLADSYGYRPNKSALDAVGITRNRCWYFDWVLEFDIRGLFDNIRHDLLMKAVRLHTENKWVILYIERWLNAEMQMPDGSIVKRTCGTPQGGVISPILSNLFLHYVFDVWMTKHHKSKPWCRYADDGIAHCYTEAQAQALLVELKQRFAACGLEMHSEKTKIVYCKDTNRKENYQNTQFTFLGYDFKLRTLKNALTGQLFCSFSPAVSINALNAMRAKIRSTGLRNRTEKTLIEIAKQYNPMLQGWLMYYGKYNISALKPMIYSGRVCQTIFYKI
jgi:RNA-directed DNA polymerase